MKTLTWRSSGSARKRAAPYLSLGIDKERTMKLKKHLFGIALASTVLLTQSVFAAPFCAVFSYGTQCWYYTYDQCLQAAGSQGACIINQEEARPPSGGATAPFCVVTSYARNAGTTMPSRVNKRLLQVVGRAQSIRIDSSTPQRKNGDGARYSVAISS